MKKLFIALSIIFGTFFILILSGAIYVYSITSGINLDTNKLVNVAHAITYYDTFNQPITEQSKGVSVTPFNEIPKHTINAFISIEDKRFYSHNGIDYKGVFRAIFNNIKSLSAKEGASTINQQLIKNTHLSNEKTLKRKLIEMKLAKQLDKKFTKNEIMEKYLNTIYFGNNCYGITKASEFYFNKTPSKLTINESAILAGMIKAPSTYSPLNQPLNCQNRKNVVLKQMKEQGYITNEQYNTCKNQNVSDTIKTTVKTEYDYMYMVNKEISKLLDKNAYYNDNLQVNTAYNPKIQQIIKDEITENLGEYNLSAVLLNKYGQIVAYYSTAPENFRQVGSTIKPIAVYAPAIETNTVYSCTQLVDEKTDFNGYSPSNYNDIYYGKISVKTSLTKSSNVCSAKLLGLTGIDKALKYLKMTDIPLTESDNSLALALGATQKGATLTQITSAYTTFINEGYYNTPTCFKRHNEKNNTFNLLDIKYGKQIFSKDTCYIINDMLNETVKNGTAKKLSYINIPLCAKTGTVGNSNGNTDAYCISYNQEYVLGVYIGNKKDLLLENNITGGTLPTSLASNIWSKIYQDFEAPSFDACDDVVEIDIDNITYNESGIIEIADVNAPKRYVKTEIFKKNYLPKTMSTRFTLPKIEKPELTVNNNEIIIRLCLTEYYDARIYRENNGEKIMVYNSLFNNKEIFYDYDTIDGQTYTYSIVPYFIKDDDEFIGNEIFIAKIKINKSDFSKDWEWIGGEFE